MIKITSSKEGILGIGSWFFNGLVALKKNLTFCWRSILPTYSPLYLKCLSESLEKHCETMDAQEEIRTCEKKHINGLHENCERTWPFKKVHSAGRT